MYRATPNPPRWLKPLVGIVGALFVAALFGQWVASGAEVSSLLIGASLLGLIPGAVAHRKGRSFFAWWLYGALLFIVAFPHSLLLKPEPPDQHSVQA